MGNREESVALLHAGLSPAQIAKRGFTGGPVSLKTVFGYLEQKVGEGVIRRSDILFAVPHDVRVAVEQGRLNDVDPDEAETVNRYSNARVALGDMYDDIRLVEVGLHKFVRSVLEKAHGHSESGWWRQGVPENVRIECQKRREQDLDASEPYCYTDLLDLKAIIDKQWETIKKEMPPTIASNKKAFLTDLMRLNEIRRVVMHPVRDKIPTEDDFEFLRDLKKRLEPILSPLDKHLRGLLRQLGITLPGA